MTPDTELQRVTANIGDVIERYYRAALHFPDKTFTAEALRRYVSRFSPLAPESVGRVLRDLRKAGKLNYRNLPPRKDSRYEWLPLIPHQEALRLSASKVERLERALLRLEAKQERLKARIEELKRRSA